MGTTCAARFGCAAGVGAAASTSSTLGRTTYGPTTPAASAFDPTAYAATVG